MSSVEVLSSHTSPTSPAAAEQPNLTLKTRPTFDQQGAFLQDKVLKSGWLQKRTRKTKSWKQRWFVLRADRLSSYKDQKEYKVHRQIYLDDVTAVATLKDAKRPNVFGIFSPSKNFHFRAANPTETTEWVEMIRSAAAVEETGEELMLNSPINPADSQALPPSDARLGSSSSEIGSPPMAINSKAVGAARISSQTLDYSGPELGSVSSLSDMARISQLSLSHHDPGFTSGGEMSEPPPRVSGEPKRKVVRNDSGLSSHDQLPRVIWHGYMYCLKSKGGVKQWKKYWVVVKNINIAFYKNEEEYRAIKILPMDNIVDAVEIDSLSKSKTNCLQIITEGKAYRFAAGSEDILVKALGAMKSAVNKNKQRASVVVAGPAPAQATIPAH